MIREAIKREAARRGLSPWKLAKLTAIDVRTVQRYFTSEHDLASVRLDKLCTILDLSLRPTKRCGGKGKA